MTHIPQPGTSRSVGDARVAAVMELIGQHGHHGWTVTELAGAVALSPSRLRHLFSVHVGMAPIDYLRRWRLGEAARLLRSSPLTVKDIMRRIGVSDSSHFARDFAAAFGVPPTRYRHGGSGVARAAAGSGKRDRQ